MFFDNYDSLFFIAVVLSFLAGALFALFLKDERRISVSSFGAATCGSVLTIVFSLAVIISGSIYRANFAPFSPVPGSGIGIRVDGISAFFLLMIGLVCLAVSIYSIGYSSEYYGKQGLKSLGFFFNLFILSMILVCTSDDVFSFLVVWETMSLTSFFLVIHDHDNENSMKSGMTYIVMTHIGTAFITGSFLLMYFQTGSLSFESFGNMQSPLPFYIKELAFIFALIGFGTKAGLVPLHIWLPQAHPSAPSNVSALMSGVMIKIAIYGLVRMILSFIVPDSPSFAWLGMLVVVAGATTSLIGVLYAAIEKDIKRALAYHSVENIGIIVLGLGLYVVFDSFNLTMLAALALLASMYHSLNHAAFKSLLFMGAGSVVLSTGTKNMNRLGGLVKKMPLTSLFFLIGSIAIVGLPPLNGFVSEWLTMQALLSSYSIPIVALQVSISFAAVAFALTLGLALATFVKMFGMTFLSKPRSSEATSAKEASKSMLAGMVIVAILCIVLGLFPFIAVRLISSSFGFDPNLVGATSPFGALAVVYAGFGDQSNLSMPVVVLLLGSVGVSMLGFIAIMGRGRKNLRRSYGTWDCGYGELDERMEYTASSLSQPIRTVFKGLYRPETKIERNWYSDSNKYLRKSVHIESHATDLFEEKLYIPIVRATIVVLNKIRSIQTGRVNAYLLYVMITLILLLILVAVT